MELFHEVSTQEAEEAMIQASITQVAAQGSGKDLKKAMRPIELAVQRARKRQRETKAKADDLSRFLRDHDLGILKL